jgi:hypothetical protein
MAVAGALFSLDYIFRGLMMKEAGMKQDEYKDGEKVVYKTKARLSLPHKESQEADCFVTENHVVIEADEQIKIPVSRIKDCNIEYASVSFAYSTPPEKPLPDTVTLTFLDGQNKRHKLSLDMVAGGPSFSSYYFKDAIDEQIARHKEPGVLGRFLDRAEEIFRDKGRDDLCAWLQDMGIDAQVAERGRVEENIECGFLSEPLGLIDIPEGPIRWVNVIKRKSGDDVKYYFKYGVPDSRLQSNLPKVEIRSKPKGDNWQWKGNDAGLGIVDRLNGDMSTGHTLIRTKSPNMTIRAYTDPSCWVISSEAIGMPSQELWDCYQAIAQHLLSAPL